ncbi:hypothetical protein AAC387_Pa10g1299 [Persea americana]
MSLERTTSSRNTSRKILPSSSSSSSTVETSNSNDTTENNLNRSSSMVSLLKPRKPTTTVPTLLRSILSLLPIPPLLFPTCRWLHLPSSSSSPSLGRRVTGTLFGPKKGHVTFAVQEEPRSDPVLLLELATPTSSLVKEMSSGLVRIALECERNPSGRGVRLFHEPMWTMYCNGRKSGYAVSRTCGESDWHLLRTVQTVSIGAGVIPAEKGAAGGGGEGELMYMRARFERVVGSRDSEAFYMLNPDGNGGPELSIFLLRV